MRYLVFLLFICLLPALAEDDIPWGLDTMLQRVPVLKHDATGRLPMVTWEAFRMNPKDDSFQRGEPLPVEMYRELAKRGLTQRIPLQDKYIPMALAMQQAGAKVIFVEGWGGNGPAASGKDPLHKLPADFKIAQGDIQYACPLVIDGWQARAEQVRATLRKYKEAGVDVTGAWLDWEVEPLNWSMGRFEQAKACARCKTMFPPEALQSVQNYSRFILMLRTQLFSAYVAGPIREIYPTCSITNWEVVYSSPELPTQTCWGGSFFPPMDAGLFTATNPVAYGNDVFYNIHWKKEWSYPLDEKHMDRVYTRVMLGQTSQDAANALKLGVRTQSVPWVCRYCPDVGDAKIPVLSRPRYREILRHLWLRGADGMQIFNAARPRAAYATEEMEDAVAVYDEMLEYRKFLDNGTVMNTAIPEVTDNSAVWSGLKLGDEAVIRAFTMGDAPATLAVCPWLDAPITSLAAPPAGKTYLLKRENGKVLVTEGI